MTSLTAVALQLADCLRANSPSNIITSGNLTSEQDAAMKLLMDWIQKRKKSPATFKNFYNINFNDFASRLSDLIVEPFLMNQGSYGLCTLSSLLYLVLRENPKEIVNYAMQLYTTGNGKLGDLDVKPGTLFKLQDFDANVLMHDLNVINNKTYFIGPDLLMMGALRDSESTIPFDFDKSNPGARAINRISSGGTNDDILGILNRTKLFTSVVVKPAKSNLTFKDFDDEIRKHKYIVLFFHCTGDLNKIMNNDTFDFGKHHCALEYNYILPVSNNVNVYSFIFVTWGLKVLQNVSQKDFNDALISYILVD